MNLNYFFADFSDIFNSFLSNAVFPSLKILRLSTIIMKLCNDCLTPIKSDSKEEYCDFCKRDRAIKSSSTS